MVSQYGKLSLGLHLIIDSSLNVNISDFKTDVFLIFCNAFQIFESVTEVTLYPCLVDVLTKFLPKNPVLLPSFPGDDPEIWSWY